MNDINNLLKDVKDKFHRDRIKRSIDNVLSIYIQPPEIISEAKLTLKEIIEKQK